MPKKEVEYYEINIKMSIRKNDWNNQYPDGTKVAMTPKEIEDRVQCGVEVPIEDVEVDIRE